MVILQVSYKAGTELSRLTSEPRALSSVTPRFLGCPSLILRARRTVHLLTLEVIPLFKVILELQICSQNTERGMFLRSCTCKTIGVVEVGGGRFQY